MASRLLLMAVIGLASGTPLWAQSPAEIGLPSPQVGDQWKYRTVDLWTNKETLTFEQHLAAVEADQLVIRVTSSANPTPRTSRLGKATNPCRRMRNGSTETCDGLLNFPVRLGDTYDVAKRPWGNGDGYDTLRCKVAAEESITVPAGTLATMRIDCEGVWTRVFDGQYSGRIIETVWYAPAVHRIAKQKYVSFNSQGRLDNQTQTELVQFARQ